MALAPTSGAFPQSAAGNQDEVAPKNVVRAEQGKRLAAHILSSDPQAAVRMDYRSTKSAVDHTEEEPAAPAPAPARRPQLPRNLNGFMAYAAQHWMPPHDNGQEAHAAHDMLGVYAILARNILRQNGMSYHVLPDGQVINTTSAATWWSRQRNHRWQ